MSNEINYTLFKIYSDTIPHYDGAEETLEIFINAVTKFYDLYHGTDPILNQCVDSIIIGKLTGRAQVLIGARTELKTWKDIKHELRNTFGDRQSVDILEQKLFTLTPNRNEHPLDFAKRIQLLRSKLAFKINSYTNDEMTYETKLIHFRQYESQSLKVFLRNLNIRLQDKISVQKPDSLEAAMGLFLEDENFRQTQNLSFPNRPSSSNNPPPRQTIDPPKQQIQRNFAQNNYQSYNRYPQTFQTSSNFKFPSQPINLQPRPVHQKFPTNRQVFGPPQNVFKPFNKPIQRTYEPMSTTSRIPSIQRSIPQPIRQQQFPSPRQTFNHQELYAHDDERNGNCDITPQPYPEQLEDSLSFPDDPNGDYLYYVEEVNDPQTENFQEPLPTTETT